MDKEDLYRAWDELGPEMDARERTRRYFAGEQVDCIPYGLISAKGALAKALGYTKGQVSESYDLRCRINRVAEDVLGSLTTEVSLGLRGIGEAAGSELEHPEDSIDYVVDFACMDYARFFDRPSFNAQSNLFLAAKLEEGRKLAADFPNTPISTGIAGPFSTATSLRPFEMLLRDTKRDPDSLHRLLDFCVDASLQWVEAFHGATGCTSVSISDPATTTDVLNRPQFLEFSKPYLERLFKGVCAIAGSKPKVHICGHSEGIWEDLADMGVGFFSIDDSESLSGACAAIGDRMVVSGNVAPVSVLMQGSIDEVIHATRQCIVDGAANPKGFVLSSGCQVPMGTPIENLIAFRYAARKYGADAVMGCTPKAALRE